MLVRLPHPAVDQSGLVRVRGVDYWGAAAGLHQNQALSHQPGVPAGLAPSDLVAVVREAYAVLLGDEPSGAKQELLRATAKGSSGDGDTGQESRMLPFSGGVGGGLGEFAAAGGSGGSSDPAAFLEGLSPPRLLELLGNEEELKAVAASWLKETPVSAGECWPVGLNLLVAEHGALHVEDRA